MKPTKPIRPLAAYVDVVFIQRPGRYRQKKKVRRCLVWDPQKIVPYPPPPRK